MYLSTSQFITCNTFVFTNPLLVTTNASAPSIVNAGGASFTLTSISNVSLEFAGKFDKSSEGACTITIVLQYYNILTPTLITTIEVPMQIYLPGSMIQAAPATPTFLIPNVPVGTYIAQVALYADVSTNIYVSGELAILTVHTGQ